MTAMRKLKSVPIGLLVVLAACGGSSSSPTTPSASTYVIPAAELSEMLSEKVLGNTGAPVSIIEYSSLTCPHCSTFHTATLAQIKPAYIDTGKVKLVYRDFPVAGASTTSAAYAAAGLARCAGNARYFEALEMLYRTQGTWTASGDAKSAMKQAVASLGIASDKMDACMSSTDIQGEINRLMAEGRTTFGIAATPTFIVAGQKIVGSASFSEFDAILKAATQ